MAKHTSMTLSLRGEGGLGAYLRAVNAAPILSADEERALAIRYREAGDLDAVRQLILSQLRSVVRIARGFTGYGLSQADLIQEGNIGLMKAVKHFDPHHGVRLVSFAVHWIRAEIYDFVLRNWRIVRVATTKAQRKLFFNLRQSRARVGWMNPHEVAKLAHDLQVDEGDVREMEARLTHGDVPFDASDSDDDETFRASPAASLPDLRYNPESLLAERSHDGARHQALEQALGVLDARSREILTERWLKDSKTTLQDLAERFGVSAERVRQLEKKALATLRTTLQESVAAEI